VREIKEPSVKSSENERTKINCKRNGRGKEKKTVRIREEHEIKTIKGETFEEMMGKKIRANYGK